MMSRMSGITGTGKTDFPEKETHGVPSAGKAPHFYVFFGKCVKGKNRGTKGKNINKTPGVENFPHLAYWIS